MSNSISRLQRQGVINDGSSGQGGVDVQNRVVFRKLLQATIAPQQGKILGEEDLYAGLIQLQLFSRHGADAVERFETLLERSKEEFRQEHGWVSLQRAANNALRELRVEGVIDSSDARDIRDICFTSAQLDGDPYKLYGIQGRRTATTKYGQALSLAAENMEKVENGELMVLSRWERRMLANERRLARRAAERGEAVNGAEQQGELTPVLEGVVA